MSYANMGGNMDPFSPPYKTGFVGTVEVPKKKETTLSSMPLNGMMVTPKTKTALATGFPS